MEVLSGDLEVLEASTGYAEVQELGSEVPEADLEM